MEEGNSHGVKFKNILIGYIVITTIISLVFEVAFGNTGFGIIRLMILLLSSLIGGVIWYYAIGNAIVKGDDRDFRSYIILITPLVVFLAWRLLSSFVDMDYKSLLMVLYGIGFIGICYSRIRQLGYGMFSGSKSLFAKDNLGFIIILGGYVFLTLLAIYVFVILRVR